MKIGLVGWGIETQSAFRYFGDTHSYVIVSEEPRDDFPITENVSVFALTEKRPPGLTGNVVDLSYLDHFDDCELVIYSSAAAKNLENHFPDDHVFWNKAKTIQHIFFENLPTKNTIGITGTKGKGTTTTLISMMLEASGLTVHTGGNIGLPVLDLLPKIATDDWVVLELSSFQLYGLRCSPHIAVHLMMAPEHIEEWHKTMDDYVHAKRNIFAFQSEQDIAIYNPSNVYSNENVEASSGKHIPYTSPPGAYVENNELIIENQKIISTDEIRLIGKHNLQNACAAVTAVWQISKNINAIREVLKTFGGLEHRLEFAGEVNDIKFYDDSFGTTPDTAIVALDAFPENKVIIIGGHDKGNPFHDLAVRLNKDDVRHVVFIGNTGRKILNLAKLAGFDEQKATIHDDGNSWTMKEIVNEASNHAKSGDVVLLSTGCASFGLFKDYKDRGNQFKEVVRSLGTI